MEPRGMKIIIYFGVATVFNGIGWWSLLLGQAATPLDVFQLIQLGGTGGLILALLGALYMVWKDRAELKKEWAAEVADLRRVITTERESHRQEIAEMRADHKKDLSELTDKYTDELKKQISSLREETRIRITEERATSDETYKPK